MNGNHNLKYEEFMIVISSMCDLEQLVEMIKEQLEMCKFRNN